MKSTLESPLRIVSLEDLNTIESVLTEYVDQNVTDQRAQQSVKDRIQDLIGLIRREHMAPLVDYLAMRSAVESSQPRVYKMLDESELEDLCRTEEETGHLDHRQLLQIIEKSQSVIVREQELSKTDRISPGKGKLG